MLIVAFIFHSLVCFLMIPFFSFFVYVYMCASMRESIFQSALYAAMRKYSGNSYKNVNAIPTKAMKLLLKWRCKNLDIYYLKFINHQHPGSRKILTYSWMSEYLKQVCIYILTFYDPWSLCLRTNPVRLIVWFLFHGNIILKWV